MRGKRPTDRRAAETRGREGERRAAWWLWLKGWKILDSRVRTPAGEVDLVVRRGTLAPAEKGTIAPRALARMVNLSHDIA